MSVNTAIDNEARFPSLASIKIANNQLLKERAADNQEFLRDITFFIHKVQATGAILNLEAERWTCQSILDYWANFLDRHDNIDLIQETLLAPVDLELVPTLDESRRPYVGLEAFRESKHDLFFGRQRLIEELVEKVADNRCMFVVGPSGSGKSSVVLAGLMPKLKSGAVKKSDKWRY